MKTKLLFRKIILLGLTSLLPVMVVAQGTISGTVIEQETEISIPGVNVLIEGLDIGTATGANGEFEITGIDEGSYTLQVRAIGYIPQTVDVDVVSGETTELTIILRERRVELDEVIVTGTAGGMQRRALGNTITSVDAVEAMELAPIPNMQSLLNARASGTVIMPGTGMVGSGSRIRIRGASSISLSNEPIIYVDGIRVDNAQGSGPAVQGFGSSVINRLNDFNPQDVESVEILKGPAAATLYGTEASNGVINIITKKGVDGAPRFSFTSRAGTNFFANKENRMFTNFWRNPDTGEIESLNLVTSEEERGTPIFEPGFLQNYNLNVRGGSDKFQYYISGNWKNEEGVEPTNELNHYGGRLNLTLNATDDVRVNSSLGYLTGRTYLARESGTGGVTWGSYFSTPEHLERNLPEDAPPRRGYRSFTSDAYYEFDDFQDLTRLTGSVTVNYTMMDNFSHRLAIGVDEVIEDNQTILENSPIYRQFAPGEDGFKSVSRRDALNQTIDYNNDLRLDLSEDFGSRTTTGFQYYRSKTTITSATGEDFALPGLRAVNAAARTEGGENFFENRTFGVFVQQQFNYQDRIYLTGGLRGDDNSAFGQDFDLVLYPKVSSAWVISEEDFFNVPYINSMRLRGSYGHTGQQPGFFDALRTFNAVTGPDDRPTVTPGSIGNPDLGPERSIEWETGFEASLLDERVSTEFTYYNRTTEDAILVRNVAPSIGFAGNQFINVGEVDNWGVEFSLQGTPIQRRDLSLDLRFSIATNDSEIQDLGRDDEIVVNSAFGMEHRVGQPIGSWYKPKLLDVDITTDDIGAPVASNYICADGEGGQMPCFDETGSLIAPDLFIGQSIPKYEGSFSATLNFLGNFRAYALIDYKTGHHKWNYNQSVRSLFGLSRELYFPLESDPLKVADALNFRTFDVNIEDASFAKLREVSLTYLFPDQILDAFSVQRASVSLAARNLYTWTDYSGMEPEGMFLTGGRGGFSTIEQNNLPQLTQIVGTLSLGF